MAKLICWAACMHLGLFTGEVGGNLLRAHAKMLGAVSCASVPKITIITGNSIGPSSYIMVCRI